MEGKNQVKDLEFHEPSADEKKFIQVDGDAPKLKQVSMNGARVSMPYIFNITNQGFPPPVVVFDTILEEGLRVVNAIPNKLYYDVKKELTENPVLIGRIRMDLVFNGKLNEEIAIGFRRKINGEVVEKKFIAPYFLAMNQFISTAIEISIKDLPLDGKTEILVYAPGEVRISLYPTQSCITKQELFGDKLFLNAVNSGWFYDDCISVVNPTAIRQKAELNFTEKGVVCGNQDLSVSSYETYLPEDKIYFRKAFSDKNIPSVIANGELGAIQIHLERTSFQTTVVDIMGRREVNLEKTIAFDIQPQSSICLFVTKNKKPLYNIDNQLYVSRYADMEFNSTSEVRRVLEGINEQKAALELLLEKNDFVIKD